MASLTVIQPDAVRYQHEITSPGLRIGRSTSNDLILTDTAVSRAHAEVISSPDGYYLVGMGSRNGTFLNDRPVRRPTLLRAGDRIGVGATTLIFNPDPGRDLELYEHTLDSPDTTILPVEAALEDLPLDRTLPPADSGPGRPSAISIILDADRELAFNRPLNEILEAIMDLAGRIVPFDRGALMLLHGSDLVPEVTRLRRRGDAGPLQVSRTVTDLVLRDRVAVMIPDALAEAPFRGQISVQQQQLRSVLCVPLWSQHDVTGVIYLASSRGPGLFTREHLRVLSHIANLAALKIESARLFQRALQADGIEQELRVAWDLQRALLPGAPPAIPGYAADGRTTPCRSVGGDCFDYIDLPGGFHGLVLADAAGHGLDAALLMTYFHASLRALCQLGLDLETTCGQLNRLLFPRIPLNRFVTLFYGILDPRRHTLAYVNAGHPPPCLAPAVGPPVWLHPTSPPIGMIEDCPFTAQEVTLDPGMTLICYSDGFVDARSPTGSPFMREGLVRIASEAGGAPPADTVQRAFEALVKHAGEGPREDEDDMTLMVVTRVA